MRFEIALCSDLLEEKLRLGVVPEVLKVCHEMSIMSVFHGLIALWVGDKGCAS